MARTEEGAVDGLGALSQFFINDGTLGDTLQRVAELACEAAPADMAGVTLLVEGRASTGVFTDPEAVEIDQDQYGTGRGPCLDAFRNRLVYRIDATSEETRWPEFARAADAHGICSTLSLPIIARDETFGALNLYSRKLAAFDEQSADRLRGFVRQAAIVLANAQVYWDARNLSENLNQAMRSRADDRLRRGDSHGPGRAQPGRGVPSPRARHRSGRTASSVRSRARSSSVPLAGSLPLLERPPPPSSRTTARGAPGRRPPGR